MGTVNDILSLAEKQLGNDGSRYWNWYTDNFNPAQGSYVDGYHTPYCAEYISYLLAMTNTPCIFFPESVAFDSRYITQESRIHKDLLQPGDIIAFDWPKRDTIGDHVGLVVNVHDGYVDTNEGNTSGGYVAMKERDLEDILFGIRPKYSEVEMITDEDAKKIAIACAEYVYGDYDKSKNINMYNAVHWAHNNTRLMLDLLQKIAKKLGV